MSNDNATPDQEAEFAADAAEATETDTEHESMIEIGTDADFASE
ncbi:hypothetical protein [Nocardia sp. NPDC056100]